MKPSGVERLTLNGTTGKPKLVSDLINALNDTRIITEKGGFLFKARLEGTDHLIMGVTPCILDGRRTYHYDTRLPGEDEYTLIGGVTPNQVFEMLFKPTSIELTQADRVKYATLYVILARFLLEQGYHRNGILSVVTVQMLEEAKLFAEAPKDLAGLLEIIGPFDI